MQLEAGRGSGFPTLLYKEVLRFWKVSFQTVAAPVLTTLLYLLVFAHALADHVQAFPGVPYLHFLIPGLAMMAMLQNAFANSSSSIIQSKITGNMVFILLPPLSAFEIFVGCGMLGTLGIIAGIWSEKFDQLAAFQNFMVMPLTFLAGVFYSVHSLPG